MSQYHIIYIPGIGDNRPYGQNIAIRLWRVFGVHGHYYAVGWAAGDFAPKLAELLKYIDDLLARGDKVALLGFSAGASAVLNAFAERRDKITAVVCVSGVIQEGRRANNSHWRDQAFAQSVALLHDNLATFSPRDKQRLLTVYPGIDDRVPHTDATITGVTELRTPAKTHVQSIAYALTIGAFKISRHIKQLTKQGNAI